jgi:hypothetical protein
VELVKAVGGEVLGSETSNSHAGQTPGLRTSSNVLPMPAELFNPCDEKENNDHSDYFHPDNNMVLSSNGQMAGEAQFNFDDHRLLEYHESMMMNQPKHSHPPINNSNMYSGGNPRNRGPPKHNNSRGKMSKQPVTSAQDAPPRRPYGRRQRPCRVLPPLLVHLVN